MSKYPKHSSAGRPGHGHRHLQPIQPNVQPPNPLIRQNFPMEYQPLVPNVPMGVPIPPNPMDGISLDKNMVMFGPHQMGMNWQHMPSMKQHHMPPMPMKMMPMPPVMMIPKAGANVVPPHMCNINPPIGKMAAPTSDKNRRLYATRNRSTSATAPGSGGPNYGDKQAHMAKNMALDMQLQSLVAMCLGKMYQTNGFWISLIGEREMIECLKSSFLQRLCMIYREACKFHQYSLDLEKKKLTVKKSSFVAEQDLKPLTEYFWHKGRMERIMKNYKNIAKLAIEQKDEDKDKVAPASDSDANNTASLNTNFAGSNQINSMNISRVSPNVMQTIEYSEVAYNQRILLAKINLQNIRATLCSDKCIKSMPSVFRHAQLNIIESMLSKT